MVAAGNQGGGRGPVVDTQSPRRQTTAPELLILGRLWSKRVLLILLTIASAFIGWVVHLNDPGLYQSDGSLLFRFDREYLVQDPSSDVWRGDGIRVDLDTAVQTDLEILGSKRVLGLTLDRVPPPPAQANSDWSVSTLLSKVDSFLRGTADDKATSGQGAVAGPVALAPADVARSNAIDSFRRDLSIRRVLGTTVVRVSFQHRDPAYAERVLQTLLDVYLAERRTLLDRNAGQALAQSRDAARSDLAAAEGRLAAFKLDHGLQDADLKRSKLLAERLSLVSAPTDEGLATSQSGASPEKINSMRIAEIDSELLRLDQDSQQMSDMADIVTMDREALARIERLHSQQALTEQVDAAMGAPIVVLDPAALQPKPVGLSAVRTAALSGLLGLLLGAAFVILQDQVSRLRTKPAPQEIRRTANRR